ncbi:hypothetical protein GGI00_003985, partial [Coemansia sp. RSA 2681]
SHSLLPPSSRERRNHSGLAAAGGAPANAPAVPGHTEPGGAPDSLNGDSVRKRSSFWKRSSTFISGGLARAGHRPASEAHPSALPSHAGHAVVAEKGQPGQFRVLSNRIFNDAKHSSPTADGNAGREYPTSPLSPHSPRMYVDPASGMVGIWKDGKLAPLDTDCAAIQQNYHDLVATDPLLSIYYLVKERRDREAGASARHHTTILLPQHQPSGALGAHVAADSTASAAGGAAGNKHGRKDSSETWVKLERAPDPAPANATSKARSVAKEPEARRLPASMAAASADRDQGHVASLQAAHAGGASSTADAAHGIAVDQTTAAIEALSLHPHARGPAQPPIAGAGGAPQPAGLQDSKKKRSSIFKRFSVIVKGARPSQRHPSAPLDSASYIVQAEGGESGYMEITLDSRANDGGNNNMQQETYDVAHEAVPVPSAQLSTSAEAAGGRVRGAVGGQRHSALDSIDEDREYVREDEALVASASRTPAIAAKSISMGGQEPHNIAPASQSLDAVGRQYLTKSLTPGQSPGCIAAEASPTHGLEATGSGGSAPDISPALLLTGNSGATGDPLPSGYSGASHSSEDLCGASSMFTNSELDECETALREQSAGRNGGATGSGEAGSPLSEKAALLEKARREIEGFDEHEGVGLLDQTPELSYRVAGHVQGSSFDAMKRRTRSSSNTVVRVLSEIVRDSGGSNNGGSNSGKRGARPSGGPLRHRGAKDAASPPDTSSSGQHLPAKSIPRHNSTGAINS